MSSKSTGTFHRLPFLDSIRAIAAIYVTVHHASINYFDPNLHGLKYLIIRAFSQGHYAVDLFIVLSGFSLMLSVLKSNYLLKDGPLQFFKHRIIRIIPTYYSAILLSLIMISTIIGDKTQTLWDSSIPVNCRDVVTHFLLINDFFQSTTHSINYVFWSIAVEWRIYLFFPILLWLWRKIGASMAVSFAIVMSVIGLLLLGMLKRFGFDDIDTQTGVSPYIILFSLGMLAADLSLKDGKIQESVRTFYKRIPGVIIACIVVTVIILVLGKVSFHTPIPSFNDDKIFYNQLYDIAIGVICSLLLFAVTLSATEKKKTSLFLSFLNWKPLAYIGTFSYSLYLLHPLVLQVLLKFIIIPLHVDHFTATCLLMTLGTITSLLVSYIFFLGVEQPFLKLGKKRSGKVAMQEAKVNVTV